MEEGANVWVVEEWGLMGWGGSWGLCRGAERSMCGTGYNWGWGVRVKQAEWAVHGAVVRGTVGRAYMWHIYLRMCLVR